MQRFYIKKRLKFEHEYHSSIDTYMVKVNNEWIITGSV